jgi:hypothetical protein
MKCEAFEVSYFRCLEVQCLVQQLFDVISVAVNIVIEIALVICHSTCTKSRS